MRTAFIVVFCIVGGIVAGMEIGYRQAAAEAERPVYLTRTCPQPEQFRPAWDCAATEAKTYCSTCLRRKWL